MNNRIAKKIRLLTKLTFDPSAGLTKREFYKQIKKQYKQEKKNYGN